MCYINIHGKNTFRNQHNHCNIRCYDWCTLNPLHMKCSVAKIVVYQSYIVEVVKNVVNIHYILKSNCSVVKIQNLSSGVYPANDHIRPIVLQYLGTYYLGPQKS